MYNRKCSEIPNTYSLFLLQLSLKLCETAVFFFCFQGLGHVIGKSSLKVLPAKIFFINFVTKNFKHNKGTPMLWTMRNSGFFLKGSAIISLVYFWIFKKIVMLAFAVFSQYFIFFYHSFEDQRQNHLNWVERA